MKTLEEIRHYALEHNVPIMSNETLDYISSIISKSNSRFILEVGTAIAYSTSYLASKNDIYIKTLEKDEARYKEAQANIKNLNHEAKIESILCDGLKYSNRDTYDLTIIDAAKAQNKSFFHLYFPFTKKIMIVDNINFHGYFGKSDTIESKNLRSMVKRIEDFVAYIESRSDLISEYVDIGDGLLIIKRKEL